MAVAERVAAPIERLRVGAFTIPTDAPESDGTLEWTSTTLVVVEVQADEATGLGYTYADAALVRTIGDHLQPLLIGRDPADIEALWREMFGRLRNLGHAGTSAMAVSAVDTALWDLKARLLDVPLVRLLGAVRADLPVYGSGGFTSYSNAQLERQFSQWADAGITRFKMKVGRDPADDLDRVRFARSVIGEWSELFVDANSAYARREALEFATRFAAECDVSWLEQPLLPDDLAGLQFLREHVPPQVELVDGEYGYELAYFRRLLEAEAVDVVMADLTRCGGITGLLKIAALCEAWNMPLSTHCAPALHVHPGCAIAPLRHAEYFHDHERIERLLFDGAAEVRAGVLHPDLTRPGHGLEFKWQDAERFAVSVDSVGAAGAR